MSNAIATRPARQQQARKPRPKPARSIRLVITPSPISSGVVRISIGHKSQDYFLGEVEGASFGRGFLVEKIGHEESYHVNIDDGQPDVRVRRLHHALALQTRRRLGRSYRGRKL